MKYQTMNKRYPKIMYKEIFLKNQARSQPDNGGRFLQTLDLFYWI